MNIWIGNSGFANSKNIENATIGFKVSKDWIDENYINADSLVLQHFNNKNWDFLPTEKIDEDEKYVYYEAKTPSFSPFAITAEKNMVVIDEKDEDQVYSGGTPQNEVKATNETGTAPQENKNKTILKIATFFVGLVIVLVIGAIIMRKKKPEQ